LKEIYIIITHNNISKGNLYENDKKTISFIWQTLDGAVHGLIDHMKFNDIF